MLKLIVSPYSFSKSLFEAYDEIFNLVNNDDWVCFKDVDVAFFEMSDVGHLIQDYIEKYPETGMFTCYATRCHYAYQTRKGVNSESNSITYLAEEIIKNRKLHPQIKRINTKIAGHVIVMQKKTWNAIREDLFMRIARKRKKILGFDTQLSSTLLKAGYDIKLMRGIIAFHYLRKLTGKNNKIK